MTYAYCDIDGSVQLPRWVCYRMQFMFVDPAMTLKPTIVMLLIRLNLHSIKVYLHF